MSCKKGTDDGCTEHYVGFSSAGFHGGHTDESVPVCDWWAWMFVHDSGCEGCYGEGGRDRGY